MMKSWLTISVIMCWASASYAVDEHIPPELRQFYAENAGEIAQLSAVITDEGGDLTEREETFLLMSAKYPAELTQVAPKILNSSAKSLSVAAVNALASSVVMSDHARAFASDYVMTPNQTRLMNFHEGILGELRTAVQNEESTVRNIAAQLLSSLDDEEGLKAIQDGVSKDLFSAEEAIGYFGMASIENATRYIAAYLDSDDERTRAVATYCAAKIPAFQDKVLNVLGDSKLSAIVRTAAIHGLAGNEDVLGSFLAVALNPTSDAAVAKAAAEAYAETVVTAPSINLPEIENVLNALSGIKELMPDKFDFNDAIRKLEIERGSRLQP